jgi:hypothetical protein
VRDEGGAKESLLGTPETSLRGLRTLKVLRVERSTDPSPSWLAGITYGRNLISLCNITNNLKNFLKLVERE